ncbi:inner membrane protein YhjD [Acerihabitans arboris]|uniref:Inner membrane protein YhjD n=1 Tax=Acerihabitans arboris TaxID=2691583 RepID=A0A845SKV7_9GAMM|nr:inner membrane protein YhjD [Acerihabitans arboris]NDL64619.1 inner membrane protein YhjD [Acerihabitans arboris]
MAEKPTTPATTIRHADSPLLGNIHTGSKKIDKVALRSGRFIAKVSAYPSVAHIIRAVERFNDRMGSQFGAAITYFSFLSLIPILMVSFAGVGFFLASNPDILTDLINKIADSISDRTMADTLKSTVKTAIAQRTTVGITGLLIALYSGLNWMGNLREAIRAQLRDEWERNPRDEEKFYIKYLRDLISLIGLILALIVTLSLTSIAGAAQETIVKALGLDTVEWLRPVMTAVTLVISVLANYLLFLWIFWVIPRHKPHSKAMFRGALLAAAGFEIIKIIMTLTLPKLATSPSGAAFGSVIGLMAFFYFFARLTLFCAAWIATAHYRDVDGPTPPGGKSRPAENRRQESAASAVSYAAPEKPSAAGRRPTRAAPRRGSARPYLMALTAGIVVYYFNKTR